MMQGRPVALLIASCLVAAPACVANTHRISQAELARLASVPPERRGDAVLVTQELSTADEPPGAPRVDDGTVVVVGHFDVGAHPHGHGSGAGPGPSHGGGSSGHGSSGGGGDSEGADARAVAVVVVALAVTGVVILAVTEGMRYSGHVRLHPMHPVHLYGRQGGYAVVPLAHLDQGAVRWARRAAVRANEGPWLQLDNAPLDRLGATYAVLMGVGSSVSADGSTGTGFASHIQFGAFATQRFGLLGVLSFGWRDNAVDMTLIDTRYSLEAQYLPLTVGRLHGGLFGSVGLSYRLEDGLVNGDQASLNLTAGALAQLELTTFLALTARFGISSDHGERTSDATVGLSVY